MQKSAAELLLSKTYKEVWNRGESYLDRGRVAIDKKNTNEQKLRATVRGKKDYIVTLKFNKRSLVKQCSCEYSLNGPSSRPACKHIVAAAIYWDEARRIKRPSKKDINLHTIPPAPISRQAIISLFKNPLKADLDKIRILMEYSSAEPQPHARLPNAPKIKIDVRKPLKIEEVKKALAEMERWTKRSLYDPYFCAGEMSAAFCELLDTIKKRLNVSRSKEAILILALLVDWFYKRFNKLIDGVEGVWLFPAVRIGNLVSLAVRKYSKDPVWEKFRKIVKIAGEKAGRKGLDERGVAEWAREKL